MILVDNQKLFLKTSEEKLKSDSSVPKIRVWDLFRRPLMRIICLNVIFSWFALSMVFYGLALNGGNLAGDFGGL